MKSHNLLFGLLTLGLCAGIASPIALAGSSGGRSSGGSFSSPSRSSSSNSSPSRSSSGSSSPSRSSTPSYSNPSRSSNWDRPSSYPSYPNSYPSYPNSYPSYPNSYPDPSFPDRRSTVPSANPPPINSPATGINPAAAAIPAIVETSPGPSAAWLILPGAAIVGGAGLLLYSAQKKGQIAAAAPGSRAEIHNDILTISTVQMALLADSPIQQQLNEIVETMEISTPDQLKEQLQAVVIALMRLTEYWSHAKVASQTFPDRTQAESFYAQGSMQERAKLSEETLTRDHFGLRKKAVTIEENADPAAYVVVTLRLGTTHDRPLFESVHSTAELKLILDKLAALTTPELLTFELIWSPQEASDSLSRDELLTEYGDLVMV